MLCSFVKVTCTLPALVLMRVFTFKHSLFSPINVMEGETLGGVPQALTDLFIYFISP